MTRNSGGWWSVGLAGALLVSGCRCGEEAAREGTGGSGPPPLAEASTGSGSRRVTLAVMEVVTGKAGVTPPRTSFVTSEETLVRARVTGGDSGLADRIAWTVQPVGTQTGPAVPPTATGPELRFRGSSAQGTGGSKTPNPPLEYQVVAALDLGGERLEAKLPPTAFVRQDESDILRQEYLDYRTKLQPTLAQVKVPGKGFLNRGNYSVVVEEQPGALEKLLGDVEAEVNRLLNDDVQVLPVGARGTSPLAVVVSPGPPVLFVGPLGDTEPQGDDLCFGPRVNGGCAGTIRVGPNLIADTRANNRATRVSLEALVTSAYRNPQRNKFIGSGSVNSRHTRGMALDLDPRSLDIPGKDARQLMCVLEFAGARVVGDDNSFTENGPVTFLECDDPAADHVHVQR